MLWGPLRTGQYYHVFPSPSCSPKALYEPLLCLYISSFWYPGKPDIMLDHKDNFKKHGFQGFQGYRILQGEIPLYLINLSLGSRERVQEKKIEPTHLASGNPLPET